MTIKVAQDTVVLFLQNFNSLSSRVIFDGESHRVKLLIIK